MLKKLFLLFFFSGSLDSFSQAKKQTMQLPKERYWFVAYKTPGCFGNIQWRTRDNKPPQKKELFKYVVDSAGCRTPFVYREFVIIGLHEFKTEKDVNYFFNAQQEQP